MSKTKNNLVAICGGGTGGSVVPLLSVARVLHRQYPESKFLFFGTAKGPELSLVQAEEVLDIKYLKISAGKFRRYFSLRNFLDIFVLIYAFFQSLYFLLKYRPQVFFAAGAFVAVPPAYAAKILGIPVLMHQQDFRPGLANKLVSPLASLKTVAFEKSLADYKQAIWIGNPVDEDEIAEAIKAKEETRKKYNIQEMRPIVLVTGGGTGADFLNQLILDSRENLADACQIIHLSGAKKKRAENNTNYQSYEFLSHAEILRLMAISDLVVSRCGLSTLTDLAFLGKPSLLIPMPDSHQEENAKIFTQSALVLEQKYLNKEKFSKLLRETLSDQDGLAKMSEGIRKLIKPGAADFLVKKIYEYSGAKN